MRKSIFLVIFGIILVAANIVLLNTQNSKLDKMSSKLDQMEMQLAVARSNTNSQNNIESNALMQKEVFTPSELAQYLGVEMSKIYDMIDVEGVGIPYVCIDGEYRFGKKAIDEWLKTSKDI
jgi:excisionase family DNA binding protein